MLRAATSPVILRFKNPVTVDPGDGLYVVFSPLRDRSPEREAKKLPESLQQGECEKEKMTAAVQSCAEEKANRLTGWRLIDRQDNRDRSVSLHFKVNRSTYAPGVWGNAWITLMPDRGVWKATDYDTWY